MTSRGRTRLAVTRPGPESHIQYLLGRCQLKAVLQWVQALIFACLTIRCVRSMTAPLEIARLKASIWPLLAGKHGLRDAGFAAHLRDRCAQLVPPDGRDDLLERMTFPRLSKPAPGSAFILPEVCTRNRPHFLGDRQSQAARRAGGTLQPSAGNVRRRG